LQLLLKKFGISSSLISVLRSNKKHATAFRLNLTGYDLRLFQKLIGLSMERKAKTLLGQLSRKLKTDTMPFLTIVRELSRELKISRDFLYACRIFPTQGQNLSRTSFTRFIEISKMAEELNKFLNFRYEKILRVERVRERVKVYDFTVEGTHTFLANGLCSSNCHMLTPPAFNALLKILEEPPAHVVFVLATTEPHKVFDTVLSRVQRFDFKKISADRIVEKLKRIARAEKISVEEPALTALASAASGSLRDAESALSKLIAYTGLEKITAEDAAEVLGIVPLQIHENLANLIVRKKSQEAIAQISHLFESGVDLEYFTKQFVRYLRMLLINHINSSPVLTNPALLTNLPTQSGGNEKIGNSATLEFLVRAINLFVKAGAELKSSPVPQLPLELAILELTRNS
jgi:DNA polymerase III delta prime subunit